MKLETIIHKTLTLLPAEPVHDFAIWALQHQPIGNITTPAVASRKVWNLEFKNPIGLAAGFDKNAECTDALFSMGFGFIEVGTITPKPQPGNPKPRLFRIRNEKALINRMGFNNKGIDYAVNCLKKRKYKSGIIGINIGKNKDTPNENALDDYLIAQSKCHTYADYVTINISSPNTPKLRELFTPEYLDTLLATLQSKQLELNKVNNKTVPLVLKLSPDLTDELLQSTLDIVMKYNIDGVIASNTTVTRPIPESAKHYNETGGFSGKNLFPITHNMVKNIYSYTNGKLPIIACGGIMGSEQANAYLAAGAQLVQVYTGFVYDGAGFVQQLLHALTK
jgi:dihydroorotate dehydrogenase